MTMEEPTNIGDWRKVCILGSGSFGIVTLWRDLATQESIAIKKCRWHMPDKIPQKQRTRWTNEVEIMKTIRHDNIVAYKALPVDLEAVLSKYNLSRLPLLSMEYCTEGNLRRVLAMPKNACGLEEIEVRYLLGDLSSAISYLHKLKITHRDIKPENIVLQKTELRATKSIYKLIDLGYAKELQTNVVSFVGTMQYVAPEIFFNQNYTCNVDYWSFGIVVFEAICNIHPFLPNLQPPLVFEYLEKKSPEDICIYTSRYGDIKYTKEIIKENHISPVLKGHLERWLGFVLRYDCTQRGLTGTGKNVFDELQDILNKYIICVFSVYNYNNYYYEVNAETLLRQLQEDIERDTGISVQEQLLITENMYYDNDDGRRVVQCFDEISINTMVVLFKKGEFVKSCEIALPTVVKSLFTSGNKDHKWDELTVQIAEAVHFIARQCKFIKSYKKAFMLEYDYLRNLLMKAAHFFACLKSAAVKMLNEIEFCKNLNAQMGNAFDSRLECVAKYKINLRQSRELIENVNAVAARLAKLQAKENLLKTSSDTLHVHFDQYDTEKLYSDALSCMMITKQKAIISPKDINQVISRYLKMRVSIVTDEFTQQHLTVTSKILREINRLFRWMKALDQQMQRLSLERGCNQIEIFKQLCMQKGNLEVNFDGYIEDINPDDLNVKNKMIRYNTQDIINQLLKSYKDFTVDLELGNSAGGGPN